jgi:hypothetical protein
MAGKALGELAFDSFFMNGRAVGALLASGSEDCALRRVCRVDFAIKASGPGVIARTESPLDSFFMAGREVGAWTVGGSEDCALERVWRIDLATEPGVAARFGSLVDSFFTGA